MQDEKRLYMYIYRLIRYDIYNRKYKYGDKLPSLMKLCSQYDVGRNTMRSALNKLNEDGYIVLRKGAQATVVFDIYNFELHQRYKQELVNSSQMTKDVYDTIATIFPEIGFICLTIANQNQKKELVECIKNMSIETITSESDLIQQLYNIYLLAFSFLDNPILNDLFMTLMNSVYQPLIQDDRVKSELKKNIKMIRTSLNMVLKFAKIHNQFMVKNIIATMCKTQAKISLEYIDEICEDMQATEESQFIWIRELNEDYLYFQVVSGILKAIFYHIYEEGSLLPSIAKLSQQYQVSEKTSRKALEVLRDYRVIETINGIGSKVIMKDSEDIERLLSHPQLKENIKEYYYSFQLIVIMLHVVEKKVLENATAEEFLRIKKNIESVNVFSLETYNDFIFSKCNPCITSIYNELKKSIAYSVFTNRMLDYSPYDFNYYRNEFLAALNQQDISKICKITETVLKIELDLLKAFIAKF